jgi:hypothetical protein
MSKTHSFKVWGLKNVLKKWVIHMAAHDNLFTHLKPISHYPTTKHYLLPQSIIKLDEDHDDQHPQNKCSLSNLGLKS